MNIVETRTQTQGTPRVMGITEPVRVGHHVLEPTLWMLNRATGVVVKGHRYGCILTQKKGDNVAGTLVFRCSPETGYRIYQMLQPDAALSVSGTIPQEGRLACVYDWLMTYTYEDSSYVEMYPESLDGQRTMTIVAGGSWATLCLNQTLRFEGVYA